MNSKPCPKCKQCSPDNAASCRDCGHEFETPSSNLTAAQGEPAKPGSLKRVVRARPWTHAEETAEMTRRTHCHCGRKLNEDGLCWMCDPISTCWPQ